MEKMENCHPGDKLQVVFHNERGTVNLSIRVSEINVHKEHLRILALNDINIELDEKEIDSWIRLTRVLTHEIMNSVTPYHLPQRHAPFDGRGQRRRNQPRITDHQYNGKRTACFRGILPQIHTDTDSGAFIVLLKSIHRTNGRTCPSSESL